MTLYANQLGDVYSYLKLYCIAAVTPVTKVKNIFCVS